MRLFQVVSVVGGFAALVSASLQIVPGATWSSVNTGEHIQAHGAGINLVNGMYYMTGEDKSKASRFPNVNCYSSANLVEWSYVGPLFDANSIKDISVIERPKILFNAQTKKYVLYMHVDSADYKLARVGVATSDSICGKYTLINTFRPLNRQSRDMGLFQEPNGAAYLLSEDRASGLRIYRLSPDYLTIASSTYAWPDSIESPAILKRGPLYYMFGSHLTGWQANDNVYSTASCLCGPWSPWRTFAPPGTKTFTSQTSFILPLRDDLVMYMGDRWVQSDLSRSTYIWLPLSFDGTNVTLTNREAWSLDRGAVTGGREWTFKANELGLLSGGAKLLGNGAAGYVGGPENGTVVVRTSMPIVNGPRNTWRIYYRNGDKAARFASVTIGTAGQSKKVEFLATGGQVGISVVTVGGDQTGQVVISGWKGSWGPDVVMAKVVTK